LTNIKTHIPPKYIIGRAEL